VLTEDEGTRTDPRAKAARALGLASFVASMGGYVVWVPLNLAANVLLSGADRMAVTTAITHVSTFVCLGAFTGTPRLFVIPVVAIALATAAIVAAVAVRRDAGSSSGSRRVATNGLHLGVARLVLCVGELAFWAFIGLFAGTSWRWG
jgi:hypothetical protein